MVYPESWTCPSCRASVFNSIKCNVCSYQPPAESGHLEFQAVKETLLKKRILAFLIDLGIIIGIGALFTLSLSFALMSSAAGPERLFMIFAVPVISVILILHPIYFIILESVYAQTYGKRIIRLKISESGFKTSLFRNITRFIEAPLLYIPSIILINKDGRRWGDKLAGTQVLKY